MKNTCAVYVPGRAVQCTTDKFFILQVVTEPCFTVGASVTRYSLSVCPYIPCVLLAVLTTPTPHSDADLLVFASQLPLWRLNKAMQVTSLDS